MNTNHTIQVIIKSAAKIGVENHSLTKSDQFSTFESIHGTKIVTGMIVPKAESII